MEKKSINLIIIAVSFFAMIAIGVFTHGIGGMIELLLKMNYLWLLLALGCMGVYLFFDTLILHLITKSLYNTHKFKNSAKAIMICKFFDSITPFSTGGQPAQAYTMSKDGIKPGHAASIAVIKSTIYQTVIVVYSLIVLAFRSGFFISNIHGFFLLYLLGFVLNLFVGVIWILLLYKRALAYKISLFIFNLLGRIRVLKKIKNYEMNLIEGFSVYEEGALILKGNIKLIIIAAVLQIMGLTIFFSIPFFIYQSIGSSIRVDILTMIATQSVVLMIASFIPSPGSSGAAEGTGYILFSLFFMSNMIIPVILIWRIITFYSITLIGGLVTFLANVRPAEQPIS